MALLTLQCIHFSLLQERLEDRPFTDVVYKTRVEEAASGPTQKQCLTFPISDRNMGRSRGWVQFLIRESGLGSHYVTVGKFFIFDKPQFPQLYDRETRRHFKTLWGAVKSFYMKTLIINLNCSQSVVGGTLRINEAKIIFKVILTCYFTFYS